MTKNDLQQSFIFVTTVKILANICYAVAKITSEITLCYQHWCCSVNHHCLLMFTSAKGRRICFYLCLFACLLDYSESYERILMYILGRGGAWPKNNQLDLGGIRITICIKELWIQRRGKREGSRGTCPHLPKKGGNAPPTSSLRI